MNNQIEHLRIARGISQAQLAADANISIRALEQLESGQNPTLEDLDSIAEVLGVPVAKLFTNPQIVNSKKVDENQLTNQLHERWDAYRTFKHFYLACYVAVMMIWGIIMGAIHDGVIDSILGVLWIFGWLIMSPLRKWLEMAKINPKLDRRYPLTKDRPDKNREKK